MSNVYCSVVHVRGDMDSALSLIYKGRIIYRDTTHNGGLYCIADVGTWYGSLASAMRAVDHAEVCNG